MSIVGGWGCPRSERIVWRPAACWAPAKRAESSVFGFASTSTADDTRNDGWEHRTQNTWIDPLILRGYARREKEAVRYDHFHPWHAWFVTGNAYNNNKEGKTWNCNISATTGPFSLIFSVFRNRNWSPTLTLPNLPFLTIPTFIFLVIKSHSYSCFHEFTPNAVSLLPPVLGSWA